MISLRADKKIEVTIPALDGTSGIVYFGSDDETVLPIEVLLASAPKAPNCLPNSLASRYWIPANS